MRTNPVLVALLFVILTAVHTRQSNHPGIYDVRKLTSAGDHSHPRFSLDGRTLYFAAKGDPYGTDCEHVYAIDLAYNTTVRKPSLYSTGIGRETLPAIFYYSHAFPASYITIVSTAARALDDWYAKGVSGDLSNNQFCPRSKCPATGDKDLEAACKVPHIEKQDGQSVMIVDDYGQFNIFVYYSRTENRYPNQVLTVERTGNEQLHSMRCSVGAAECLYASIGNSAPVYPKNLQNTVVDGLAADLQKKRNGPFFYHGYKPTDKGTETAIAKGVVPTKDARIYTADFEDLFDEDNNVVPERLGESADTNAYVYPAAYESNKVLATRIPSDANGKLQIAAFDNGGDKKWKVLSDANVNAFHAVVDPTNSFVAFVSDEDGTNQLYLGKLASSASYPTYTALEPNSKTSAKIGEESTLFKQVQGYVEKSESGLRYLNYMEGVKLNSNGILMFTAAVRGNYYCPQIYQVNTQIKDIGKSTRRRLSSGYHWYSSPNFLPSNGDILFASTLTKKYTVLSGASQCEVEVCTGLAQKADATLERLCAKVVKKRLLPKESELYIANEYGSVKRRLTNNDVFDGEATVSPSGDSVVYSTYVDGDYELVHLKIGETSPKKLTNAVGFESAPAFSLDGKFITYTAFRPQNETEKTRYSEMARYGFTDVARSEIFVYSFDLQREFQVTRIGSYSHSPLFLRTDDQSKDGAIRLIFASAANPTSISKIHGVELVRKSGDDKAPFEVREPVELGQIGSYVWSLSLRYGQKPSDDALAFIDGSWLDGYEADVVVATELNLEFPPADKGNSAGRSGGTLGVLLTLVASYSLAKLIL